ncbi:MAG: HAD family phosphatase [Planctomycetota bacterium]
MIEFIYFDLGKVILNFDHSIGCQQVSNLTGISPESVSDLIFQSGEQVKYETGLISSAEFHRSFCEKTKTEPELDSFLNAVSDIFTANRPIFSLIGQLNRTGVPIGILSNTCEAHWDFVSKQYPILVELFGPKVLSFESKSMKPDAKIYVDAVSMADVAPENCFFVDDRQENVDGAVNCGIDAVLYRGVADLISQLAERGFQVNL